MVYDATVSTPLSKNLLILMDPRSTIHGRCIFITLKTNRAIALLHKFQNLLSSAELITIYKTFPPFLQKEIQKKSEKKIKIIYSTIVVNYYSLI